MFNREYLLILSDLSSVVINNTTDVSFSKVILVVMTTGDEDDGCPRYPRQGFELWKDMLPKYSG